MLAILPENHAIEDCDGSLTRTLSLWRDLEELRVLASGAAQISPASTCKLSKALPRHEIYDSNQSDFCIGWKLMGMCKMDAKLTLILTMNGFECRTMRQATKLSDWQWALGIFLLSMSRPRVSQNFLGEGWLFPEVVKVCPLKFLPTQISNQFWALLFGMRKCGMKEAKMDD